MPNEQQPPTKPASPDAAGDNQRETLEQSERRASEKQPDNYKDESTDEKVVEVGGDLTADPIKGIDPDESAGKSR